jgi:flagellar assembly factor FliW
MAFDEIGKFVMHCIDECIPIVHRNSSQSFAFTSPKM